jgi:hypothetical protein
VRDAKRAEILHNSAVNNTSFFRAIRHCEFFLLLFLVQVSAAQSFIFASPNTRSHMSDTEAFASQDSFEQQNFLAVAHYLGVRLCGKANAVKHDATKSNITKVKVYGGEGLDGHDTENTALVTGCKGEQVFYVAELLGRYAHQKQVLVFSAIPNANERLFVISLSAVGPEEAVNQMHKHGLAEGTVITEGEGTLVYIWEQDHSQDAQIHALSEDNHGTIEELAGKGLLIGDDDRAKAQQIFDKKLSAYERQHHVAFSQQLWTKKLHDLGGDANQKED